MAPTEGRVVKPERQWDCHHGTPNLNVDLRVTWQLALAWLKASVSFQNKNTCNTQYRLPFQVRIALLYMQFNDKCANFKCTVWILCAT